MRKVNLRNVDPAIDDPDASTWSHPTLNRHSPPEVVANFKRRVPPRLPKPRKRDLQEQQQIIPPPRSAIPGLGTSNLPLSVQSSGMNGSKISNHVGRSRGFSAPGSFTPLSGSTPGGWSSNTYPRSALPPLTVPSEPHHNYGHHSLSPSDESPTSSAYHYPSRAEPLLHHTYNYPDSPGSQWYPNGSASSSHNGSLSSLLNPSSNGSGTVYTQHSRPTPTINTAVHSSSSYNSPFSSVPLHASEHPHSASSLSPDGHSRPATGYSASYDDYESSSRPHSSHRQICPPSSPRPSSSSRSPYHSNSHSSMIIRRHRRHSQVMSPYPSPYEHGGGSSSSGSLTEHQRPSSSPQPDMHHGHHNTHNGHGHYSTHNHGMSSLPRVRSMMQLSSDTSSSSPYAYSNAHDQFAYSPIPSAASASSTSVPSLTSMPSSSSISSMSSMHDYGSRHPNRPGTAASSMSVASSSSQANTPPMDGGAGAYEVGISTAGMGGDAAMVRGYESDYGFVSIEHHELQSSYGKEM